MLQESIGLHGARCNPARAMQELERVGSCLDSRRICVSTLSTICFQCPAAYGEKRQRIMLLSSVRDLSVSQIPLAEGKSVQQTVELLTRKLEQMGAEKQGTFYVDCETYHTAGASMGTSGQTGKLLYIMHNSEYPLSTFALFENGPCLVADLNLDVLMVKLKGFFQNAKANKMETRGTRYQYCDFLVKIGTVTMGQSGRGISVEVDYCPCAVPGDCWNLLNEFMQSFMGNHAPSVPPIFNAKHDSLYTPADTMVQYMELLNKIRKQQQGAVTGMR